MSQLPSASESNPTEPSVPSTHPQTAKPQPPQWLGALEPRTLWSGAVAAAAAYGAVFLASAVLLVVALVGVAASNDRWMPEVAPGLPETGSPNAAAIVGQFTAQLVAMAHFGAASTSIEGVIPFVGAIRGDLSVFFAPLGILAVGIFGLYSAGRIAERKLPSVSRWQLLAQSLVSGIVYALLTNVVAALAAVRIPSGSGITATPITAAGFWPAVFALILGFGVSAVARSRTSPATPRLGFPASWSKSAGLPFLAVSSHLLVFVCVMTPVFWVITGVSNGWAGVLSAPLVALNAAGLLFVAGHFGGLWFHAGTSLASGSATGDTDRLVYGFDAGSNWGANLALMLAIVLLAVLCTIAVGVLVLLRRGYADNSRFSSWCGVPFAYLLLGLALFPLLGMSASFTMAGLGQGSYILAPVWWSPAVFLLWGILVEVIARYAAPYLLPFIPKRLQTWARAGITGSQDAMPDGQPIPTAEALPHAESHPVAGAQPAGSQPAAQPAAQPPAAQPRVPAVSEALEGKRLSPAGRKKALLVASTAGVVAVLVVAGLVTISIIKGGNGPDKVVGKYLQALIDGDAEQALRIADLGVANDQRALLTNAVYGAAAKRIDGYTVLSTETSGNTATVRVEVRQDGRLAEVPFTLNKERPELLDDHWRLKSNGAHTVRLSSDMELKAFSVNGVSVGTAAAYGGYGSSVELPAFPGEYTVAVSPSEKYLSAEEQRVIVAIGTDARAVEGAARLEVRANEELLAQVNREVAALTGKCAASAKLKVEGCPFYKYEFGDVRKVKWRVPANPKVSLNPSLDGTWRISTEFEGTAEVNYERNASFSSNDPDWKAETDTMSFSIYGRVTFDSGEPAIELSRY